MMKKLMLFVFWLLLVLSMVGCGTQAAEDMITLTLTPEYASDITAKSLNENMGTKCQSFERQADNSVVVKMTSEQYTNYIDYIRSGIISVAQNMVANYHNNIADITFNDDFSEFEVTVKTDTLLRSDADMAYYTFTSYGRFYHYLVTYHQLITGLEEGLEDCPVVVTFWDVDGNILAEDYKTESNT